ncbi:multiple sugar transport system ATP-binding protein [Sphingomonas naasensis]|uniref:sn-glycerol-3-phosphate ABC transporter ATP-binding protein UgpC n=1 Tax=Sphingomonas naasensis TaxID=1344951 RepID=A0A4S1WN50_9SPHN|nr:sn-glycerol-3-phosphate ABC transporter ATP-binding protein UgpC [Sphingomonas naasensis]NIJ20931.1 multiple sugar transport system ATP-binding protein [Sphingomonas naasensis]TGX43320.1 sn-glycerol-3-phosphate ABC transporter ATP-binding protein UgpC [Sphingomonas naasensis]
MAGVQLAEVGKAYGAVTVIERLSLDIPAGEFMVFLGPSGCGKSTLLRMIAGLETIDGGTIRIGERRVDTLPPGERGVAMVFQHYALYPHLSVRENMAFGLRNLRVPAAEIAARIAAAAASLEIEALLERKPGQLSGGQRQRVAIARAIVKQPELFLLDEPLSNLDAALRVRTRLELAQLHRRLGTTMIFVTHDQVEAMTLADRIVVLNAGGIEQVGTPMEIYLRPRTQFVATFVGSPRINLLPVAIEEGPAGSARARLGDGTMLDTAIRFAGLPQGAMTLGLRAETVCVTAGDDAATHGTAEVVERLGERTLVHTLLSDGSRLVAEDAGVSAVRPGDRIGLTIDAAAAHLFDATGLGHHRAETA